MLSTRKTWIIATILLAVVLVAAAWMLLLSPVREDMSKLRTDAQGVEDGNEILGARVAKLREQYNQIDELRAELADYEVNIPTTVNYRQVVEEIERSIETSEVVLIGVENPEPISAVTPYTATTKASTSSDPNAPAAGQAATAGEETTVSGAPPTVTGALAKDITGFYQLPLSITVQGDLDEVRSFSKALQEDSSRAILVYAVSAEALDEAPATDSAPASEVGDMTYVLSAMAYVLDYDTSVLAQDTEQPEATMPAAGSDNPFAPAGASR